MKTHRTIATLVTICTLSISHAYSITVDELARYIGVTAISTTVDLPSESFVTEVWTIKNGLPDKLLIEGMPAWNRDPEKGITVMIGNDGGKYKVVVAYGGGVTMTANTDIPTFRGTLSGDFPKSIGEGDFPLFGEPKAGGGHSARETKTFVQGFLLRIKKNG